jgi:hypothetical protein
MGDEPVGCLRLRFFADFAKIERLAIRKEFRKSQAAFQLVRASFQILSEKGLHGVSMPIPRPGWWTSGIVSDCV